MPNGARGEFSLQQAPRRKLAETVAQQLLEAVGKLEPGTRIPSEKELTQRLGVGRSTVREALNGLALLGVVEIRHGQGVFVASDTGATDTRAQAPDAIALALAKGVTHELLEVRQIVEVAQARLAAQRRTEAELNELDLLLVAHARSLDEAGAPMREASQFHVLLAGAAHNDILATIFQSFLSLMLDRGPRLYEQLPGFAQWELEQHRHIFEAVRASDAELAGARMHDHVAAMETHYKRAGEA